MSIATRINADAYYHRDSGLVISRPSALKVATQYADRPLMVHLPDGKWLNVVEARKMGFTFNRVAGPAPKAEQPTRMTDAGMLNEAARYRAEIMALPEAQERPASAEKIAEGYGFNSMPVARAASILRGLPSEIDELAAEFSERRAARAAASAPEDSKLQRKVELRILGLRGATDPNARRERTGLTLALATARESRISVTAALARVGIDATRFA